MSTRRDVTSGPGVNRRRLLTTGIALTGVLVGSGLLTSCGSPGAAAPPPPASPGR